VTKKEIVKQISDELGLTQLKTKEIVQKTFNAIVETLLREKRIELRNFGVFEVKRRKARKARNPRTGEKVDVEPKNVVTFKPGKEMEERVRQMELVAEEMSAVEEADAGLADQDDGGDGERGAESGGATVKTKSPRKRNKASTP
jgi:nucleoid DNA-binding protein